MSALSVLQSVSLVLMALTTLCYAYQFLYLILPLFHRRQLPETATPRRFAILIAARNEEAVLPHLLDSIAAQDYPAELITTFVIADNCTDATADTARAHGAVVYTRFNKREIGKGYALNFLLENIRRDFGWNRFDAFLIFDADNLLSPDYVRQINRTCEAGYEAFGGYRNSKNFGTNWISAGHSVWYLHESVHMNLSRFTLGSCCAVNGTGFGFTSALLDRLDGWDFHLLTEDIEFSNWCAVNSVKIGYCHDAILYDEQPESFPLSWKQRTRWTQGGLQVSLRYGAALFRGLLRGKWISWSCHEFLTLSLWGYGLSALTGVLSVIVTLLSNDLTGICLTLLAALLGAYGSLFLMGALTVFMEWKRIRATTAQKIRAAFTFPIYMASFLPIAALAVFRKFEWAPIEHTVAISASELCRK